MAFARKDDFSDKDIKLADYAKALSHPARIAILRVLAKKQECICGDLVADLPLAQSTVSQHIKALKEVGLIRGETDGPRSCYCIDWKSFEQLQKLMSPVLDELIAQKIQNKCSPPKRNLPNHAKTI